MPEVKLLAEAGTPPPGAQPQGAGSGTEGAPPCNTAPSNCISGAIVKIIGVGIDSLYLSFPGRISLDTTIKLRQLKELAQSRNPLDKMLSSFQLGYHLLEVLGKGAGYFPYVLRDNAYYIKLSSLESSQLPMAYVQTSSQWLTLMGLEFVMKELEEFISSLGTLKESPQVSRADLYVDFITTFPQEELQDGEFMSRAKNVDTHTVGGLFTGHSFGLGGDISARLYDKTAEIKVSKKEYLIPIWTAKGWNGTDVIYRLEFQLKRKALVEHRAKTVPELLIRLGAIWRYCTLEWLKQVIPSPSDDTKSRWPIHPVWSALAEVDWPDDLVEGTSIPVRSSNIPSDKSIFVNGLGGITALMARDGITDSPTAFKVFQERARAYHNDRRHHTGIDFEDYLREKAALKSKAFNIDYPGIAEKRQQKLKETYAKAYRKAKDGD